MRLTKLALLASGLVFAAGCGSGGDDETDTGSPPPQNPEAQVRFVNLLQESNPIDIYRVADLTLDRENAMPVVTSLSQREFSEPFTVPGGPNSFAIFRSGEEPTPQNELFQASGLNVRFSEEEIVENLGVLFVVNGARMFREDLEAPAAGGRYRFINTSANSQNASVRLFDANDNRNFVVLEQALQFGSSADIDLAAEPASFLLGLAEAGTNIPEQGFAIPVAASAFYAFITDAGADEQLLIFEAGNEGTPTTVSSMPIMLPGEGRLNFINLADGAGNIDVIVDGEEDPIATDLALNAASRERTRLEGSYSFSVESAAGEELATLEDFVLEDGEVFTLVVYDDPAGDVVIGALPREITEAPPMGETRVRFTHLAPDQGEVDILEATDPGNPNQVDPGLLDLSFGSSAPAFTRVGGSIELGLNIDDATDDPRDDIDVVFNAINLTAGQTFNVFLDSTVDGSGDTRFRLVALPTGGQSQTPQNGSTIPDPTEIRAIHLGLLRQNVDFFESNDTTPVANNANIPFRGSGSYAVRDADDATQLRFSDAGVGIGGAFITETAPLAVTTQQTVALYGPANDYQVTVFEDDNTSPTPGTFKVRLINAATGVPSVQGGVSSGGPAQTFGAPVQFGTASPYIQVAAASEVVFDINAGTPIRYALDNTQISAGRTYNAFFVNDVQNGQQFLTLQDDLGGTVTEFRPARVRALNLLSSPMNSDIASVGVAPTSGGGPIQIAPTGGDMSLPFNARSALSTVQEGGYNVICNLASGFGVSGNMLFSFDTVSTVVCAGYGAPPGIGTGAFLAREEQGMATAGQVRWRFANFAAGFPMGGGLIDILDPEDAMTPFQVGVGRNTVPAGYQSSDASGFTFQIDPDPTSSTDELITFDVPELPDGRSYTFYLSRSNVQGELGSLELVIVDGGVDTGNTVIFNDPVVIGPTTSGVVFNVASGLTDNVDIFVDSDPTEVVTDLGFGGLSPEIALAGGERQFDVAPTGTGIGAATLSFTESVDGSGNNTVALFGDDMVQGAVYPNRTPSLMMNQVALRFLHTSEDFGDIDIYDADTDTIIGMGPNSWDSIAPGEATSYQAFDVLSTTTFGIDIRKTNSGATGAAVPSYDYFFRFDPGGVGLAPGATGNILFSFDPDTNELIMFVQQTSPNNATQVGTPLGRIRLVNVSGPDATAELFVDGSSSGLGTVSLGDASDWATVFPGSADLEVRNGMGAVIGSISGQNIRPGGSYTVLAVRSGGTLPGASSILVVEDNLADIGPTDTRIRGINAAPGIGNVDIIDETPGAGRPTLFSGVTPASASATFATISSPMGEVRFGFDRTADGASDEIAAADVLLFQPGQLINVVYYINDMGNFAVMFLLADSVVFVDVP